MWMLWRKDILYLCRRLNPDSLAIQHLITYLFFHLLIDLMSVGLFRKSVYVWFSDNGFFIFIHLLSTLPWH
jgi:hypothetical protein